jgi:hypothetical protein
MLLLVFRHVYANEVGFGLVAMQIAGYLLGQLRFANARRAQEQKYLDTKQRFRLFA